jgi:methylenetetrahydrofolate reductase (NADPH)
MQHAKRANTPPPTGEDLRQTIIGLVRGCSVESAARDAAIAETCNAALAPGTSVYMTALPGDTVAAKLRGAVQLRRAGLNPVPHVSARHLQSRAQLDELLSGLAGEAAVEELLVIGGDADRPAGPFVSSLELIQSGLFEAHGIRRVGIAGYPEGHPRIAEAVLAQARAAKIERLRQAGIAPRIVTQFCFEAAPILAWLSRFREGGGEVPVHIGLAGPASVATLLKFAVRCGIGTSLRALRRGAFRTRLLADAGPEPIIRALAAADVAGMGCAGLHFFTFGGIARTSLWIRAVSRGDFEILLDGNGFRIRT